MLNPNPMPLRRITGSRLPAAILGVVFAALLGPAFARDWPAWHEVKALNKAYTSSVNATYLVNNAELADQLNLRSSQLTWADQVCDLPAFETALKDMSSLIFKTIDGGAAGPGHVLKELHNALPHSRVDANAFAARWSRCAPLIDADLALKFRPAQSVAVSVPCLGFLRGDRKDILWCERRANFYSQEMASAAAKAIPAIKASFLSCGALKDHHARTATHVRIYEAAEASVPNGVVGLRDAIVDEFDLRRSKRAGLAADMLRADRSLAAGLYAGFNDANFRKWCELSKTPPR